MSKNPFIDVLLNYWAWFDDEGFNVFVWERGPTLSEKQLDQAAAAWAEITGE